MSVDLGTVLAPSGKLLVIDAGLLNLWSHDRKPVMPDGILDDAATARANRFVDATLVGRDADAIGRQLDRQWHPRFIYDIPRDDAKKLASTIKQLAKEQRLDAKLEIVRDRVPHRRRADHALAHGGGAGEVQFHGVWAGVVQGVPTRELRVVGEPMPADDPDAGRLRRITLIASDAEVARSEQFALAAVDWARLMFVDLDAVGLWQHDEPLDGRADFVFWGRDAADVARRAGAAALDADTFGWRDLLVHEAAEQVTYVEELRARDELAFATDFRPHSHHYLLMEQIRASASESGTVTLGTTRACGFMTTWGDGLFELHRDLDARGALVQIRIELGTEQRRTRMRQLELRWSKMAVVTKRITEDGHPVRFLYREAPDNDEDSGRRMFAGDESDDYANDTANIALVRLSVFADLDARVDKLLDEPIGSVFERAGPSDDFYRVTDWARDR